MHHVFPQTCSKLGFMCHVFSHKHVCLHFLSCPLPLTDYLHSHTSIDVHPQFVAILTQFSRSTSKDLVSPFICGSVLVTFVPRMLLQFPIVSLMVPQYMYSQPQFAATLKHSARFSFKYYISSFIFGSVLLTFVPGMPFHLPIVSLIVIHFIHLYIVGVVFTIFSL